MNDLSSMKKKRLAEIHKYSLSFFAFRAAGLSFLISIVAGVVFYRLIGGQYRYVDTVLATALLIVFYTIWYLLFSMLRDDYIYLNTYQPAPEVIDTTPIQTFELRVNGQSYLMQRHREPVPLTSVDGTKQIMVSVETLNKLARYDKPTREALGMSGSVYQGFMEVLKVNGLVVMLDANNPQVGFDWVWPRGDNWRKMAGYVLAEVEE